MVNLESVNAFSEINAKEGMELEGFSLIDADRLPISNYVYGVGLVINLALCMKERIIC